MPYFTPPGGDVTAALARSLMGMGIMRAQPRLQRFQIPAPVVMARAGQQLVMSGMGLGILPSVNVRYTKTAIPAALARRWRLEHPRDLQGLGAVRAGGARVIGGGRPFDVFGKGGAPIAAIKRQAGFFMGPGGGPGGGPFQFPGFMAPARMHGFLGQDSTDIDIVTGLPCDDPRANCGPMTGSTSNPIVIPANDPNIYAGYSQQQQAIDAAAYGQGRPSTAAQKAQVIASGAMTAAPTLLAPGQAVQQPSFFSSSTLGIPNAVLAVGLGAAVLLAIGRRRRNSSRRPARSRRRRS